MTKQIENQNSNSSHAKINDNNGGTLVKVKVEINDVNIRIRHLKTSIIPIRAINGRLIKLKNGIQNIKLR